jgi:hypothetical protein
VSKPPRRPVTLWSVGDDGARRPFPWSGFRIPFGPRAWAQVDFRVSSEPISVSFGVRARRDGVEALPPLTIGPRAGNRFVAFFGDGSTPRSSIRVVPVGESTWNVKEIFQLLAKYTSGDIDGEMALADAGREAIGDRWLVIQYGDLAHIDLRILQPATAALGIDVFIAGQQEPPEQGTFTSLEMSIRLNASNLITCQFFEQTGVLARGLRSGAGGGD